MDDLPVLLVHGFASSFERNWREPGWVDLLTDAGRSVISLDLPGHGEASKSHDPADYDHMDQAIVDVLPADTAVDAIGFSMGAGLLLRVASALPDRFGRIVVGGVGENLFRGGDSESLARAIERGDVAEGDSVVAQAFSRFAQAAGNDPAALAACMRRPSEPLTAATLSSLHRPVLVVLGDLDFAGPPEPLVEALPDARLIKLPGLDHFGTPKDFRFIEAALGFLGALPS